MINNVQVNKLYALNIFERLVVSCNVEFFITLHEKEMKLHEFGKGNEISPNR